MRHPLERRTTTATSQDGVVVHAVQHRGRRPPQHRGRVHPPGRGSARTCELVTGRARPAPRCSTARAASASSGRRTAASSSAHAAEVVVCGGTIGSAQLLLLSGIGPADHLRSLGVDVVADLPGVGENLHDHLLSPVIFSAEREIGPPSPGLPGVPDAPLLALATRRAGPDIQPIHFMVPMYEPWMEGPDERLHAAGRDGAPASRGTLRLTGPSARGSASRSTRTSSPARPTSRASSRPSSSAGGSVPPPRSREWGAVERYPGPRVEHGRRRARSTCARRRSRTTTRSARARWASTPPRSSIRGSGCTASRACGSPTRRSCPPSRPGTRTRRRS